MTYNDADFLSRKRKDNKGTRDPQVDEMFWEETRILATPLQNTIEWVGQQKVHVIEGKVTSHAKTVALLQQWMAADAKAVDLDVKFPRLHRLEAMREYLEAQKAGDDNPDIKVHFTGKDNVSKEWLSSWRLKLRTEYEYYTNIAQAVEARKDGLIRFPNTLYKSWASKSEEANEKKKAGQKDDNQKTHKKLIDWYEKSKDHHLEQYFKPPVTPLEFTYLLLVQAHVDASGNHKGRDATFDFLHAGKSDTITKEIVAEFIRNCPTCGKRFGGTRPKTSVAVKSEPKQTSAPSKKRKNEAPDTQSSKHAKASNNVSTSHGPAEAELDALFPSDHKQIQHHLAGHSTTGPSIETQQPLSYLPYTQATSGIYNAAGEEFVGILKYLNLDLPPMSLSGP